MSLTINFTSEDEFLTMNPWFHYCLDNRIENRVRQQLNSRFPALFREQVSDSKVYQGFVDDLRRTTDTQRNRLEQKTREGEEKLEQKTYGMERKLDSVIKTNISLFSDQKEFTELRERVQQDQQERFMLFQQRLENDHNHRQQQQAQKIKDLIEERNNLKSRVTNLENNIESTNGFISFGLLIGLGFFIHSNLK